MLRWFGGERRGVRAHPRDQNGFYSFCAALDARAWNRAGNSRKSIFSLSPLPFFASAARTDFV